MPRATHAPVPALATALTLTAMTLATPARSIAQVPFHRDTDRTVLVTGAAAGIGKAIALRFAAEGYRVYATDVDTTRWADLRAAGCRTLELDVTSDDDVEHARAALAVAGDTVDVLVNNAGYGQNGFLEELPLASLRRQFEVNAFSLVRLAQAFAPGMRTRGRGLIVNIGSVGGDFTSPGASAYHASKYAVESLNDGLRQELARFGIDVALVKPGGVATEFTAHAAPHYPDPMPESPYLAEREAFLAMAATVLDPELSRYPILAPEEVAAVVFEAATARRPKTRYRVGITARAMPWVRALRSDRGVDRMMWRAMGR